MKTFFDYDISHLNTFGINTIVDTYIAIESTEDITVAIEQYGNPTYILGGGSNVILPQYLPGVMRHICIVGQKHAQNDNTIQLTIGAGEQWDKIVHYTISKGRRGIENLIAIPGNCGSAPVQNIGAYGVELADVFVSCTVYNIQTQHFQTLTKEECCFGYRDSVFKQKPNIYIILDITLQLSQIPKPILTYKPVIEYIHEHLQDNTSQTTIASAIEHIRRSKLPHPQDIGNCGSFFKNPIISKDQGISLQHQFPSVPLYENVDGYKVSAARLIDQAGMKGYNNTKVGTYEKQPLVLININNATKDDVIDCMRTIQNTVYYKFGIMLEREVNIW